MATRPRSGLVLTQVVENAFDRDHLKELIEGRALTGDTMDVTRVRAIREEMERADARRLQPHFIASFFLEAFKLLGGKVHEREPKRYEITHVPGRDSQPRPADRTRRCRSATLRADHLREGIDRRPWETAGRVRLSRPSPLGSDH